MSFQQFQEVKIDNLTLRKVTEQDSQFITELFQDTDIRKYYIVPKEAHQDYKQLLKYWLKDIANGSGYAWIIYIKDSGLFSSNKPCGFFAFEFRGSLKNTRISYALSPKYRKQGIITKTAQIIIEKLKNIGVETIEADIDQDNTNSERLIQRLGFTTNKISALVDPEMVRNGEVRFRFLWHKDVSDYSGLDFNVIKETDYCKLFAPGTNFRVWEEEVSDYPDFALLNSMRQPTGRYHFLFQGDTTEILVGLSNNTTNIYNVPWELVREETVGPKRFMVFTGWGDPLNGGNHQFEGHEIGIDTNVIYNLAMTLSRQSPIHFAPEILNKVIGFENLQF